MNVLVADDSRSARLLLAETLENAGHEVTAVENGRQALTELCRPNAPRLAFLDWLMPELDGTDVCREIRKQSHKGYVYLVLVSSKGSKQDIVGGLESGADDYLIKPFDAKELNARLRTGERILQLETTLLEAQEAIRLKSVHDLHEQKLAAVGRLAAGIAHEINTPIQFVGDNTRFLQGAYRDREQMIEKYKQIYTEALAGPVRPELLQEVARLRETADWDYATAEIPKALEQLLDGVGRVAKIVRAMKEFSHMDRSSEKVPADLNKALESTLTVARSELKYVADVKTEYAELPSVSCHAGDLNQVFLNLLINAAHAVGDVVKGGGERGLITVRTKRMEGWVEVSISDTGNGIPESVREKIFDPFFTTKEVGKGTGQGLTLARAIVVDQHSGTLTFETVAGKGTTFYVRLPIK